MLQGKLFVNNKTNDITIKYYEYSKNGYRNMMKSHDFSMSRQIIVTTGLIKKILGRVCINDNYFIGNLNFIECIEPDEQHIQIITQLNQTKDRFKNQLIEKLNKEITELSSEKGNDIQSIEVLYSLKHRVKITLFSNGVITANTDDKTVVSKFINDILDGVINVVY